MTPVLEVESLSVKFRQYGRGLRQTDLEVISDLSLRIKAGEIMAVVGSSGSGKSLLAHAIMGILPKNAKVSGTVKYNGEILTRKLLQKLRGSEIALIPQSVTNLDPMMKIGPQVRGTYGTKKAMSDVFTRYGLDSAVEDMYAFQLSGGMARRVLISTAAMSGAKLIIADEPTPGLDPKYALETVENLRQMADQGMAVMLITHDLELAFKVADNVAVFYGGQTLEIAPTEVFLNGGSELRHPYSRALWEALPQNGFTPISGTQPYAGTVTTGCVYSPRCERKTDRCLNCNIKMRKLGNAAVRCLNAV